MKTKASVPLLAAAFLLTGCASLFKAPPEPDANSSRARRYSYSRNDWIEARASQLQNKGMSGREAKSQALTEAALRGR